MWREFRPYVSVAQRRAKAERKLKQLAKQGRQASPVRIAGHKIATTFWGLAWCENLEAYSDYANRLPRGRTYVRNGSVVDLQIQPGRVTAMVSGSEIYDVAIELTPLAAPTWKQVKTQCAGRIGSLVDLLQGKLSKDVMSIVTEPDSGLFPKPTEIKMKCSCPDSASLCKHLAAVLYGIGARLDEQPELLFLLRKVDHLELVAAAGEQAGAARLPSKKKAIADDALAEIFGIEMESSAAKSEPTAAAEAPPSSTGVKLKARRTRTPSVTSAKASTPVPAPEAKKSSRRGRPAKATKPPAPVAPPVPVDPVVRGKAAKRRASKTAVKAPNGPAAKARIKTPRPSNA